MCLQHNSYIFWGGSGASLVGQRWAKPLNLLDGTVHRTGYYNSDKIQYVSFNAKLTSTKRKRNQKHVTFKNVSG